MSDSKDLWQVIINLFGKRIVKTTIVLLGLFSAYILFQNGVLDIGGKSFDWSHLIKNEFFLFILIVLPFIAIVIVVIKIWDLLVLGYQEIKKLREVDQENKLRKSQEQKMKEELKKLPIDEKELLLRHVIKGEKKIYDFDYLKTKALENKGLIINLQYRKPNTGLGNGWYEATIYDFVFDELEKELENHIEKEIQDLDADERNFLLNACRITESKFIIRRIKNRV